MDLITLKSFGVIPTKKKVISQSVNEKNYDVIVEKDRIVGHYTNDLNLVELHNCVLKIMDTQKKEKLEKYQKLKLEEEYKISKPQYPIERKESLNIIQKIKSKTDDYTNDTKKKEYITRASPIINEYVNLGPLKIYVMLGKNMNVQNEEQLDNRLYRFTLIEKYLDIASNYVNINIYKKSLIKGCISCGYNVTSSNVSDNGNIICPNCNIEITQLSDGYGSSENGSSSKKGQINYEGRTNFYKELSRHQGKLKSSKVPNNLTDLLDEYFKMKNFPLGIEIKNNPDLLKLTSKELMYKVLKYLGFSKLYKDINLICHLYWGWKLVNIEELETQIMEKYDIIHKVYEEIKDNRTSSLNTQYELWWILDMMNYPCSPSDFKIPKTLEIFDYHEKKREQICKRLGWPFEPLNFNSI